MTYHTFTIITPSDGRRIVAPEAEWAAVERLPAGTVVDVRGDVFEDWQKPMSDTDGTPMEFTATRSNGTAVARTVAMQDIRDRLFAIVDGRPDLTFIVTTRHPDDVAKNLPGGYWTKDPCPSHADRFHLECPACNGKNSRRVDVARENLWISAIIRTQAEADAMIPVLLKLPAAKRVVDVVPGEAIDFTFVGCPHCGKSKNSWLPNYVICRNCGCEVKYPDELRRIDLVRIYGEADPIHPGWVRSLIQQCETAGVAVQFLGWGEWVHDSQYLAAWEADKTEINPADIEWTHNDGDDGDLAKVGRDRSGRMIDGREVMQWPEVSNQTINRRATGRKRGNG